MPSYSIALLVSFLAFICGQLFDALCMSFQPTGMELENFLVTGISFRTTLVAIVLRALPILVVHGTILLLRRHLCSSVKHELDDTFKTVAAAASVPARNDCEPSLAALASAEVIPLLKKSTALSASTDKVASPPPSSFPASGPDPQDSTAFVALNETAISTCRLNVKEEVDTDTEHILSHSLRIGECIQASPDQDDSVHARHSQVPLLLLVAAAAQLRRLRAKAFDESCDAKIVEVVESAEEFEKIDDAENSSEEVAGETMQTLVVEANSTDDAKIIEDVPGDHAFGVPLIEELDGVPTYEEFVQDAPLEPLFEKKAFAPLVHVIHRPPPLSLLAVRASVKPRSEHIPRLPLLARLFSRRITHYSSA